MGAPPPREDYRFAPSRLRAIISTFDRGWGIPPLARVHVRAGSAVAREIRHQDEPMRAGRDMTDEGCATLGGPGMPWHVGQECLAYWIDAAQRTVLFLDVLAQRGERYREQSARTAPHVLKFRYDLIMDGSKLS